MKKGFSGFWRGKGFYLALTLVIAGAATASFFAVNSMMTHFGTGDAQSRIDGEETTPWDTQSAQQAEKKQEDVPVSSSSSSASQSGASSQASSQASSAAPSDAASAPGIASPSYVWPVEGEVTQSFTGDELVYNETMGDWRTHNGIDVVSKFGGAVFSPSAGEVKLAQTGRRPVGRRGRGAERRCHPALLRAGRGVCKRGRYARSGRQHRRSGEVPAEARRRARTCMWNVAWAASISTPQSCLAESPAAESAHKGRQPCGHGGTAACSRARRAVFAVRRRARGARPRPQRAPGAFLLYFGRSICPRALRQKPFCAIFL